MRLRDRYETGTLQGFSQRDPSAVNCFRFTFAISAVYRLHQAVYRLHQFEIWSDTAPDPLSGQQATAGSIDPVVYSFRAL